MIFFSIIPIETYVNFALEFLVNFWNTQLSYLIKNIIPTGVYYIRLDHVIIS